MPSLLPSTLPSSLSPAPSLLPSLPPTVSTSAAPSTMPSLAPSAYYVGFDIIGQSGKFRLSTRNTNLTVALDSLYELDADDNKVGTSGKAKHSIETFANQQFVFDETNVDAPYNGVDGPNATILTFRSPVSTVGTIEVQTFIFNEEGTVTTNGSIEETAEVTIGDFKWNIELREWDFCGNKPGCKKDEFGEKIDVTVELKGQETPVQAINGSRLEYDMGGGIQVFLSRLLLCDGDYEFMEEGYPKYEVQGSKNLWTFRFPRFETSCMYDPVINSGSVLAQEIEREYPSQLPSSSPTKIESESPSLSTTIETTDVINEEPTATSTPPSLPPSTQPSHTPTEADTSSADCARSISILSYLSLLVSAALLMLH